MDNNTTKLVALKDYDNVVQAEIDVIKAMGVEIIDTPQGTTWRKV